MSIVVEPNNSRVQTARSLSNQPNSAMYGPLSCQILHTCIYYCVSIAVVRLLLSLSQNQKVYKGVL